MTLRTWTKRMNMSPLDRIQFIIGCVNDWLFVRFIILLVVFLPIIMGVLAFVELKYALLKDCRETLRPLSVVVPIFIISTVGMPKWSKYLWHNFICLDIAMTVVRRKYKLRELYGCGIGADALPYFCTWAIKKEAKRRVRLKKKGVRFNCGRILRPVRHDTSDTVEVMRSKQF